MALVNSFGALGGFCRHLDSSASCRPTPETHAPAYLLMAISLILSGVIMLIGFRQPTPRQGPTASAE